MIRGLSCNKNRNRGAPLSWFCLEKRGGGCTYLIVLLLWRAASAHVCSAEYRRDRLGWWLAAPCVVWKCTCLIRRRECGRREEKRETNDDTTSRTPLVSHKKKEEAHRQPSPDAASPPTATEIDTPTFFCIRDTVRIVDNNTIIPSNYPRETHSLIEFSSIRSRRKTLNAVISLRKR